MIDKITLLIHGPFKGNGLEHIFAEFNQLPISYREKVKIVLVSYVADFDQTYALLHSLGVVEKIHIVQVKDVFNPGFFNINRQIVSVNAGLQCIEKEDFVIKLRNDQWVSFRKLFKILDKADWLKDEERVLSTNCFTRKDRLYHPSDMFLCGWKKELVDYYDMPLINETHLNVEYKMIFKCRETPGDFQLFFECPEKLLFTNYLRHKNWDIKNTFEDSYESIKRHVYLINSWDIGFRWNKKRNPVLKKGSIILPYYFTMAPFKNAPKETARCYMRHDFSGKVTTKDLWYISEARILYFIQYTLRRIPRVCLLKLASYVRGNSFIMNILKQSPFRRILILVSRKFNL